MIRVRLLSENYVKNPVCKGEYGLSIWIERGEKRILFDTGASGLFSENARALGVDPSLADACVISHGHFDHTGGMVRFLQSNSAAPLYIHKNAFGPSYGTTKGKIDEWDCGVLWKKEELASWWERIVRTDGPVWLDKDTVISGTVPDVPEFRPAETFYRPDGAGGLIPDDMSHEQFLALREPEKGVVLFSGCSHKGVVAAVRCAKTLFPGEPIYAVVAGMHLAGADRASRERVIEGLAAEEPRLVVPIHCTGLEAVCMLKARFGDRCVLTGAGGRLTF